MKCPVVVDLCEEEDLKDTVRGISSLRHIPVQSSAPAHSVPRKEFVKRFIAAKRALMKIAPQLRRLLLEVFKFLSPYSVELEAALACRAWLQIARDEELWKTKYIDVFKPTKTEARASYRTEYLNQVVGSCWNCNQYIAQRGIICEQLRRMMCQPCSRLPDCRTVPIENLLKQFMIQAPLLEYLKVPVFMENRKKCTYVSLLMRRVVPYYERRRDLLVNALQKSVSKSTIRKLREFDFRKVFAWSGSCGPKHMMALFLYCGKNEQTENPAESIKTFMDHIKLL